LPVTSGGETVALSASDRIVAVGDAAVLLTLGERVDPELAERAQAIAAAIDAARAGEPAVGRAVPAHASVLVPFDPLAIDLDAVIALVEACFGRIGPLIGDPGMHAPVEIAVRYGGADGPDLDEVAAAHGLGPADVVELHAGATYRVLFLGFAAGFAYLGGLPAELVTPRRATPRARVPAGSVGIAGEQTGVYPLVMPGGWQLIGRTEARLWDATRPSPAFLRPGDRVRFVPL
jgi:KipI family sensor histidine kinase inhibitor